jgi:hypothetical protein
MNNEIIRKYNFRLLERKLKEAYLKWLEWDNKATRHCLFIHIHNLSYAILNVKTKRGAKFPQTNEIIAYEYTIYLFDRIISKTFHPEVKAYSDIPWQKYINLNIRHVIYRDVRKDDNKILLLEDLEFLINKMDSKLLHNSVEKQYTDKFDYETLAHELKILINTFYTDKEIRQYLPICMEILYNDPYHFHNKKRRMNTPIRIIDFYNTVISLSKRILDKYNSDQPYNILTSTLKNAMRSSLKSTIFLASVVNANFFPKELLLALDIDSLYRLVNVLGGRQIKIPTIKQLNTIVGSVIVASNIILGNEEIDKERQKIGIKNKLNGKQHELPKKSSMDLNINKCVKDVKQEFDLSFADNINIRKFISNIINIVNTCGEDKNSNPILDRIYIGIKSLDDFFSHYINSLDNVNGTEILQTYSEFMKMLNKLTTNLSSMRE